MKAMRTIFSAVVTMIIGVMVFVFVLCAKDAIESDKEDWRNYGMSIGTSGVEVTYTPDIESILENAVDEFLYVVENGVENYR